MLRTWWQKLLDPRPRPARPARRHPPLPARAWRPRLVWLEDRITPATRFVDNPADFLITTDQGAPGLDNGDTVTWNPGPGSAHGGPVAGLIVGTDAFATIQGAVNAAAAGDTIRVGPGTFSELVTVNKPLALLGNQVGVDARSGRAGAPETVVNGADLGGGIRSTSFDVTASGVVLDGFTVQQATSANMFGFAVVLGPGTSGSTVRDTIIQDSIAGISVANANAATPTLIERNLIRNNNQPGPVSGTGIYSDQFQAGGALAGVQIQDNAFVNNADTAVSLASTQTGSQSNVTVTRNQFAGNGRALLAFNLVNSAFTQNDIANSTLAGSADVRVFEGVSNLTVANNTLQGNGANLRGLRVSNTGTGAPAATGVIFTGNSLSGYGNAGVELDAGAYTGPFNATGNWWGSPTGPTAAGNLGGTGLAIVDPGNQVTYSPYLTDGTDSQPAAPGFQPAANAPVGVAVVGTAADDTLVVTATGPAAGSYSLNGGPAVPFTNLARLTFTGLGGNDALQINNPAGGLFAPVGGIVYDGGPQTGVPGDGLQILGGAATTATYTFTATGANGHNGLISLVNGAATANYVFAGLEPITNTGTAAAVVFNLPGGDGDNQAVLEDNGSAADNISQIRSGNGTFETTAFTNPTTSLTVNTGNDGETVTVAALDPAFNPAGGITVGAGAGVDLLRLDFASGANIIPAGGVAFIGAGANDGIVLLPGYAATTVTYNYAGANAGSVVVDGRTLAYAGLSPTAGIADLLAAANRVFNFPATDDAAALGDNPTPGDGVSRVSSTASSPVTDFRNPTAALTVNLGLGADTITAGPLDAVGATPVANLNGFDGTDVAADGGDTFNVTPSPATRFNIDGDNPTPPAAPGDVLNVNALNNPVTVSPTAITAGALQPVTYAEVETVGLSNNTATNVVGTAGNDTLVLSRGAGGPQFSLNGGPAVAVGNAPFSFDGQGGTDTVVFDFGAGNPVPAGGTAFANVEVYAVNGTAGDDTLTLQRSGAVSQFSFNGGPFVDLPGATSFAFNGLGGNDTMRVLYVGGDPVPAGGVAFDGGTGADRLGVFGSGTETATYAPSATTPGNGTVTVSGRAISFANLAPVDLAGMATANVVFPNGDDVVAVQNGFDFLTGTVPALRVSGTSGGVAFEALALFGNGTVNIDTSMVDGNDTVTVVSATNAHNNANLSINTGPAGTDALTVAAGGGITLTGQLTLTSQAITVNAPLLSTGGGVTLTNRGTLAVNNTTITAPAGVVQNGTGGVTLSGTVAVTTGAGPITFQGAITAAAGTVASFTSTGGGAVSFNSTFDGPAAVTVNTAGATTFVGPVGAGTPLTSLATTAPGTTAINGGLVRTTGAQTFGDNVTLGAAATQFTSTGDAAIAFNGTLDGASAVTVTTGGLTTFAGAVGATTPLASLTTNGNNPANPGTTDINGGSVTTTGNQTYFDDVVLTADTTLSGANVIFARTVDSDAVAPRRLTVVSPGVTAFQGPVGNTAPLASLTTDPLGTTDLNSGSVTTVGDQTYSDDVVLTAPPPTLPNTILNGANVTFVKTVNSDSAATPRALVIDASGATTFNGAVGKVFALSSLTTGNTLGVTRINGGFVITTIDQTYNTAVTLGAAGGVTLLDTTGANDSAAGNDTTGGGLNFNGTLDGTGAANSQCLAIQAGTTGNVIFGPPVGSAVPLGDVAISSANIVIVSTAFTAADFRQVAGTATTAVNGPMTVSGPVGLDVTTQRMILRSNVTVTAVNGSARLNAQSLGVTQEAGALTVSNLLLTGAGTFSLPDGNGVTTLAANVAGPLTFRDANGLVVGQVTVPAVSACGVATTGGTAAGVNSNGNDVTIVTGGPLLLGDGTATLEDVTAAGRTITLASQGGITQRANSAVFATNLLLMGSGGAFSLTTPRNDVGVLASATAGGPVAYVDVNALTVGAVAVPAVLGGGQVAGIQTTGQDLTLVTGGLLTLGDGTAITENVTAAGATVDLSSAGGVVENANSALTAGRLRLRGAGPFALPTATNDVATLAANVVGPLTYRDVNALTVGQVAANAVTTAGINTNANDLTLITGGLLALGDGTATAENVTAAGHTITLASQGGVSEQFNSALTAANLLLLGNGTFSLTTPANDVAVLVAATAGGPVAYVDATALTVGALAAPAILGGGPIAGIQTTGQNLTLLAGGLLTLGDGSGTVEGVLAAGATIDLRAAGVTQNGNSNLAAANLRLRGPGTFVLATPANDVTTLAADVTGTLLYTDANALTVGSVTANGLTTDGITARGITADIDAVTLNTGTDLTFARGVNTGGAAGGRLLANTGLAGIATVTLPVEVLARHATFNGGNAVTPQGKGDTFVIRPSAATPITVNGNLPTTFPGDSLQLILDPTVTDLLFQPLPGQGNGQFLFTRGSRQTINFTSIESLPQANIAAFAVQTGPQAFTIVAQGRFGAVNSGSAFSPTAPGANPFVVAPNLVNPTSPFGPPRLTVADVNGDAVPDLIVAAGPASAPLVTVINGNALFGTQTQTGSVTLTTADLLAQFYAYDPNFIGGVFVATADFNNDGKAEIITGADAGGGPHVRVFQYAPPPGPPNPFASAQALPGPLGSFFAYDPAFLGGVRVAAGDVDGDGTPDIVTGAGPGGGPHVEVFSGRLLQAGQPAGRAVIRSFFAYDPAFRGGVYVGAGDYNRDGLADIVTGAGAGGGPHVKVFSGANTNNVLASFMAFTPETAGTLFPGDTLLTNGVGSVALALVNPEDNLPDILVSSARGQRTRVAAFLGNGPQPPRYRFTTAPSSFFVVDPVSGDLITTQPLADGSNVAGFISSF